MLKLAEELLLLAYDEKGNIVCNLTALNNALTGALLIELLLLRRVSFEQNYLVLIDTRSTGDDILDEVVSLIEQHSHLLNPQQWINRLQSQMHNIRGRLLAQLIEEDILTVNEEQFLWIFKSFRYPEVDTSYKRAILNRIRIAVSETKTIPLRTNALIGLIGVSYLGDQLVNSIFTPSERKEAKQKIKLIQQENIIYTEVAAIISSIQTATSVAVTGSITLPSVVANS